jgi:hypothetical protein
MGFAAGDRVRVANDFFRAQGATGTISAAPDAVVVISGTWDGSLTRQTLFTGSGSTSRSTMPTEMARIRAALCRPIDHMGDAEQR